MRENLFAYTAPGGSYPGYVSVNRLESGEVEVTVRAAPATVDGVYVCANPSDRGKPGRCFPGDDTCNNYCNMAPQLGPMQDSPKSCSHVNEGVTASFTIPAVEWDRMRSV